MWRHFAESTIARREYGVGRRESGVAKSRIEKEGGLISKRVLISPYKSVKTINRIENVSR